tara:strand:+ start:42326 stop:42622 length:297 start_codon:yes stop_codon:yes gene_type:complete
MAKLILICILIILTYYFLLKVAKEGIIIIEDGTSFKSELDIVEAMISEASHQLTNKNLDHLYAWALLQENLITEISSVNFLTDNNHHTANFFCQTPFK